MPDDQPARMVEVWGDYHDARERDAALAGRVKSRRTAAVLLLAAVAAGAFMGHSIETIWTNANAEALAVSEYRRGM